jgi:hypothetical protein
LIAPSVFSNIYFEQIYHVWEGYLRKIPVERWKISRAEWRGKFSLKTGIFRKYPICKIVFAETLVTKFVKRYQLCVLCNNRICCFYPSPRRL